MSVRSLVAGFVFLTCLSQSVAAPVPRQVSDYPAAHAVAGELPGAMAVDARGYTYLAGTLTAPAGGHAPGAIYATRIDPSGASRLYTAYLDASGFQRVTGAAVDADGNLYITGYTSSVDFPVIGGVQRTAGGGLDAFVAKLDSKGRSWLYSTYFGGTGDDVANGIAVDRKGNAYITGWTMSGDRSGFLAEISADGSTLLYSTHLSLSGNAIAVDAAGAVYIAGSIAAESGEKQAYFLKTLTNGSSPEYFRILDATGPQEATSIALDPGGNVYIAGSEEANTVFAAKFTPGGDRVYSTPIAGMDGETAPTIAADSLGNAYVASGHAGLLVKLSADGGRQLSSEALPVTGARGIGLAVMGSGRAVVAGQAYAARVSTCSLWLSQSAQTVPAEGGAANVAVQTTPECDWHASASAPWVEASGSAAGSGTLSYRAAPNRGPARTATIAVGRETVIVTQAAGSASLPSTIRDNPGFRVSTLASCDDCSSAQAVPLGFSLDFYGRSYSQAWVNANGNITFDAPNGAYTPEPLATLPAATIAPFWADTDTRRAASGSIRYGRDMVDGHAAFGVTWTNVGRYAGRQLQSNDFQVVLIDRSDVGPGAFDVEMNFGRLEWDAGEASARASARAGFTNGTGQPGTWLELPGSGETGAFLDDGKNSLIGRHTWSVRPSATLAPTTSTTPAASTPTTPISAPVAAIGKPQPHQAAVGTITEFPIPISGSDPAGITTGPDGAMWFTDIAGYIGRMTIAGAVTEAPDFANTPHKIVTGSDGAVWFADYNNSKIGRITTSGAITEYSTPTTGAGPNGMVAGPDGNVWFTEYLAAKIGRITPAGVITEYPLSHAYDQPQGIAVGPDNALWFTEYHPNANSIGRITTAGSITDEFHIPTNSAGAIGIAKGSDGNLWFAEYAANKIGKMTTAGGFTEYPLSSTGSQPNLIAAGADGALWFAQYGSNQIGRIATDGTVTEYPIPTALSLPLDITAGPDGAIWFTESHAGKIGRVVTSATNPPVLSIAKTHTGNFSPSQQGATYTVTVSNAAGAGPTTDTVTVTEMLPAGLTLVSMAGTDWTCPNNGPVCTCPDTVAGGNNFPPITVTVNVAYAAATPQVNEVVVAGGGSSAVASISDSTVINSAPSLGTIEEFPVPISGSVPWGLTTGPDGNVWFTDWAGYIGRMTTAGAVIEAPAPVNQPRGIVTGPDGNLWYADFGNSKIGRITPGGAVTEYPTPTTGSGPNAIVVGPDQNLWFTEYSAAKIGRITTAGVITEFPLSHTYDQPEGITIGPDHELWFAEYHPNANSIGRITTSGVITEFVIPTNSAGAVGIAAGPDGNLWFTEYAANKIGSMTTAGVFTEYPISSSGSQPDTMVLGPDGALWFTQYGTNQIGRITTGGLINEYPILTANSLPVDIAVGPDGAIWFTESHAGKLGRVIAGTTDPAVLSIATTHSGDFLLGQQGATYTVTVSNAAAAGAAVGTVTVTEMAPAGLTLVSMAGDGWTCPGPGGANTCTRSDPLSGGSSYQPITVTVNVAASATTPQVNAVTVSGGGSAPASDSNSTVIDLAASVGTVTEYPVPISGTEPWGLTSGPDGAIWFTDWGGFIGRMTTAGAVTEAPDPAVQPRGIVTGPDGNLWFADFGNSKIGQITPSGVVTEFPTPTSGAGPNAIIAGPDGNLWFTEFTAAKIGRITTAGVITEFPLSHTYDQPEKITVGPDNELWFVEYHPNANAIGRITTSGTVTEFVIPTNSAGPVGIAAGSDGNLWFTEYAANKIGSMTTAGVFTEYPIASSGSQPDTMVLGPDGALWFTQYGSNQIGRITTGGLITEYPIPTALSLPVDIAVGPDNAIWFTETHAGKLGRISTGFTDPPALTITTSHIGFFAPSQQGTYTISVSNLPGSGTTAGPVTVTDSVTSGLTLVSMSGTGWTCGSGACTRSDPLSAGNSYDVITVKVNVAANASSPQVNEVTVSGGGAATASASDSAIVTTFIVGSFTEYKVPTASSEPNQIVTGPDGALWFTEFLSDKIGRLTTDGAFTEYPVPTATSRPAGIAVGSDNALWFTEGNANKIGTVSTGGAFNEYTIPTAGSAPARIVAGPDGNLWFTEYGSGKIGRITTAGVITEYPLSHTYDQPYEITVGPDKALWFTEYHPNANSIGRITTAGAITEYAIPTNNAGAVGIVTGSDGALWFAEFGANKIGRMTTDGVFTEYGVASSGSQPFEITSGPDAALWFTQYGTNQIGRMTTTGLLNEYTVPTANSGPYGITVGPDNALWFAEFNTGKIGRTVSGGTVVPVLSLSNTHTGNFMPGQQGATYTVTVSNFTGAATTKGTVTVTETVPTGLTLVSMAGPGWTCPSGVNTCTRSDGILPGSSYPIVVTVNVTATQPEQVVNLAAVSVASLAPTTATDPTIIGAYSPCDVNQSGDTNVIDVQLMIDEALGTNAPRHDLDNDHVVSVADVQFVIDAVLGWGCVVQ